MSADGYLDRTLAEFMDDVAAETPAPGGGSVAAITAALAASLAAMVARLSRKHWEDAAGAVAQAESLRARVAPLAQEDAVAYETVLLARRLPSELEPDVRDAALGDALSRAADVPLAIAEAATDVASLAAELARLGNPNLHGDASAAAVLAEAAVRVAAKLVEINLATREGDERLLRAHELAEHARRCAREALEPRP
jgi:formiminotetrahydrofolate cyclodeaminase